MENKLTLLKSLYEQSQAEQIKVLLDKNEITSKINYSRNNLEVTLGQHTSNLIEIFVYESDIENALELVQRITDNIEEEIDISDYSIDELKEIILNKDDWHESFVIRAEEKLKEIGINLSNEKIQENINRKIEEVRKGVPVSKLNITMLWILSLCGAFLGLAAGYFLWQSKTRDSNGVKCYLYDSKARNNGKWMLIIGAFITIIITIVLIKIYHPYYS